MFTIHFFKYYLPTIFFTKFLKLSNKNNLNYFMFDKSIFKFGENETQEPLDSSVTCSK